MELRVLRYFLAVAEEGNITWAAQLLRISQPTLSRQLKQLEGELGVTLFERGSHTITLTEEGRLLRERAQTIVSLADKTEFELKQSGNDLSGEIAVGCGVSARHDIAVPVHGCFSRAASQRAIPGHQHHIGHYSGTD